VIFKPGNPNVTTVTINLSEERTIVHIRLNLCKVRSFHLDDAPSIARYANNRKIWINLRDAFPHPYGINNAIEFISMVLSQKPETIFTIEVESEASGAIGFRLGKDVERISAEIGYWLAEPLWGQGIMTEVLNAVTQYALDHFKLERVFALPFAWNSASFRVLEKCGYQLEGRMRKSSIKDGKVIDQLLYAYVK
jgi:ribosomal-protein-alanine N-acetyltransferase